MELYDTPEGRYRPSFLRSLEHVKREIPLQDYAATLTELRGFGPRWWVGRCPLPDHEDRTPSFYVYPAGAGEGTAHAHCYGCDFHGDLFDLFRAVEGGALWEAAMELARRFDVELPKRPAAWFGRQERQAPIQAAIDRAKFERARRRLYKTYFRPLVVSVADEADRRHDEQLYWEMTGLLARRILATAMGVRDAR